MEGRVRLRSLTLRNVLSFGPKEQTLDFEPLTVLIGPNGSGKSNLIDILGLLRSLPHDLSAPIQEMGGFRHWAWKGGDAGAPSMIESTWDDSTGGKLLQHRLSLESMKGRIEVVQEVIQLIDWPTPEYRYQTITRDDFSGPDLFDHKGNFWVEMDKTGFRTDQSILSQRKDIERYSFLAFLSSWLSEVRLYRDWVFGRSSQARIPQNADLRDDFLSEDTRNLSLVLKRLLGETETEATIVERLKTAYDGISGLRIRDLGEYTQVVVREEDDRYIPANRLSDGTLRFLCLLAILCEPTPLLSLPVVCIEEPELGLHPDIIPTIARLLIDASRRMQLIVTTHSAELITALGDVPESVVVCERGVDGTVMRRPKPERLEKWLSEYTLGHLWSIGEIGGNRW